MKKRSNSTLVSCMIILFFGMTLQAQTVSQPRKGQKGAWRVLGTTSAQYSNDHDAIIIKGPYDYFRKLKLKVTDAPLHMRRMVVRYENGGRPEEIDLRQTIRQGGESRIIDLRGGKRKLKTVEFWYDTKGFLKGKAEVTLFGIK